MRKRQAALLGEIQIAVGPSRAEFRRHQRTRVDDAGEFRQHAVASGFDDAAVMLPDLRIDDFDEVRLEAFVASLPQSAPIRRE